MNETGAGDMTWTGQLLLSRLLLNWLLCVSKGFGFCFTYPHSEWSREHDSIKILLQQTAICPAEWGAQNVCRLWLYDHNWMAPMHMQKGEFILKLNCFAFSPITTMSERVCGEEVIVPLLHINGHNLPTTEQPMIRKRRKGRCLFFWFATTAKSGNVGCVHGSFLPRAFCSESRNDDEERWIE